MKRDQMLVNDLLAWINQNIENPIRIEDVAARAGYSKWHLQRLFQAVTGKSLGEYIRQKRLSQATQELIQGHNNILYIALKYGYCSQQSFTRVFTRKHAIPPGKFREKYGRSSVVKVPEIDDAYCRMSGNHP
ncbi:TPA: helix-turn-helix domain-containing protein [Klebsiella quasipneumoniae subsp. similipneumoniae]|nr:helix-turn-helix domain-containing protein [Klebsiella quasipneumoniae subsp. similipneumoniae]